MLQNLLPACSLLSANWQLLRKWQPLQQGRIIGLPRPNNKTDRQGNQYQQNDGAVLLFHERTPTNGAVMTKRFLAVNKGVHV